MSKQELKLLSPETADKLLLQLRQTTQRPWIVLGKTSKAESTRTLAVKLCDPVLILVVNRPNFIFRKGSEFKFRQFVIVFVLKVFVNLCGPKIYVCNQKAKKLQQQ